MDLASNRVQFYKHDHQYTDCFDNIAYCEEVVLSLLELRRLLAVVDQDLTFVNDLHLRETLLGVHENIDDGGHTDGHECTDHNIVLSHRLGLLLGSLHHGCMGKVNKGYGEGEYI